MLIGLIILCFGARAGEDFRQPDWVERMHLAEEKGAAIGRRDQPLSIDRSDAPRPYDHLMRKRWILYLVLFLLVGRAWGLHLPAVMGQAAPCHTEAVHGLPTGAASAHALPALDGASAHAAVPGHQGQGDAAAASSERASEPPSASASAPEAGAQGDGHVCCLVLLGAQDGLWPVGFMPMPDRLQPSWTSASHGLDLRPPIQGL